MDSLSIIINEYNFFREPLYDELNVSAIIEIIYVFL